MRAYVDGLIESAPNVAAGLESAARKRSGGYVVLNFTTLLPRLEKMGSASFARKQLPVLKGYAKQTEVIPKLKDYHRYYSDNALGLKKFLKRA